MFCTQCGKEIPDKSKFCGICGAKQEVIPVAAPPAFETEIPVEVPPVFAGGETEVSAPGWVSVDETKIPNPVEEKEPKKPMDVKKILTAVGAVVVVIAMILGGMAMFANKDSDNVYVCYSDGKYKLVTNVKKAETLNIASAKNDDVRYSSVKFSPDGKYIYFFTKNSNSGIGTLCRAEYAKLKENSNRNDKYIDTIASNVRSSSLVFTEKGELLYRNGDDTLYHYNGKEVDQIAKRVGSFYVDEKDRVVYSVHDDEGQTSLYGIKLKKPDEKTKLISNCGDIHLGEDFDNILYTKYHDDGTQDLYKVDFTGKEEKLGEDAMILTSGDKVYVTIGNGEKLSLYQFVNDPNAVAEAGMREPVEDDFHVTAYSYTVPTSENVNENELYTSCTNDLYWYGQLSRGSYSMEEALEASWGNATVQIHEATRNFINKHADSADSEGYIKVTPAVKADLQAINTAGGGEAHQWLGLCYERKESGTKFDYDAWYAANDQWYQVAAGVELREQLQSEENAVAVKNLCVFENGKLSVVANNVVSYNNEGNALYYNTVDMLSGNGVNIDEVYSAYDVRRTLDVDMAEQNYFVYFGDGSKGQITEDVLQAYEEAGEDSSASLHFTDNNVYLRNTDGYLAVASYKDGKIGNFEMISDEASNFSASEDMMIYAAGVYYSDGASYCDVYEYKNGKSTLLARDVLYDTIRMYEDGQMLVYTDYSYYSGYDLGMVSKKGDISLVADGVTSVTRVDKSLLLFISDDDLFSYDGKNKKMICSDVERFWTKESMSPEIAIYD